MCLICFLIRVLYKILQGIVFKIGDLIDVQGFSHFHMVCNKGFV